MLFMHRSAVHEANKMLSVAQEGSYFTWIMLYYEKALRATPSVDEITRFAIILHLCSCGKCNFQNTVLSRGRSGAPDT